jgi:ankyrin repeat protein
MSLKKRGLFQDHDDLEFRIVKMLLAAGANVNIKAKDGKSPFTLSFENGITDLLKVFGGKVDLN